MGERIKIQAFEKLLLLILAGLLVLPGCSSLKEWKNLPATKAEERTIYVVSHGWHTGVVLSRQDIMKQFEFMDDYFVQSPFYEFGWGEADYYQAEKKTVFLALKALFWRNDSVMHVAAFPALTGRNFADSQVVKLNVSKTGLDHLRNKIYGSFKFDENKRSIPLKKGQYGESRFFKAEGYYFFFNTCNRWTAEMLESAGVPMDSIFTLRARSVIRQAEAAKESYVCCRSH